VIALVGARAGEAVVAPDREIPVLDDGRVAEGFSVSPSGTVMPLVTCMMPCPQSNETRAGPMPSKGTEESAWVMTLSIQAVALRSTGGTGAFDVVREPRTPCSMAGVPK
jgi:hypothetical protein